MSINGAASRERKRPEPTSRKRKRPADQTAVDDEKRRHGVRAGRPRGRHNRNGHHAGSFRRAGRAPSSQGAAPGERSRCAVFANGRPHDEHFHHPRKADDIADGITISPAASHSNITMT